MRITVHEMLVVVKLVAQGNIISSKVEVHLLPHSDFPFDFIGTYGKLLMLKAKV